MTAGPSSATRAHLDSTASPASPAPSTPSASSSTPDAATETTLVVSGMTCGACSARIERRLGRLDGVEVSVNLTTGRARIRHGTAYGAADLIAVIITLGFGATEIASGPTRPAPRPDPAGEVQPSASPPSSRAVPGAGLGGVLEHDAELGELRHRVLVSVALTVPVIAVAMVPELQFRYWQWFTLVLAAPVVIWGGWRFHRSALRHLRHGSLTMDTLVSLGSMTALIWSVLVLFLGDAGLGGVRHGLTLVPSLDPYGGARTIYLEVAAAIVAAVLVGRWLELRGRRDARAIGARWEQQPCPDARLIVSGRELRVPLENVEVGDDVVVLAEEVLPCDGRVVSGSSALDVRTMTGEALPIEVTAGARVLAGSINGPGRLVVRVEQIGEDTQWARMAQRVQDAQVGKAAVQRLADRVAARFVPAVLLLAVWTFGYWCYTHDPSLAVVATISVLVVACPCALGLATPTALAVAVGRGAQLGILLRGPQALEASRRIDTVVLDKTGTLTTGAMTVHDLVVADGGDEELLVRRRVATLERDVDHPVALALRELAGRAGAPGSVVVDAEPVDEVEQVGGLGVRGRVGGAPILVGRALMLKREGCTVPPDLEEARLRAEQLGRTTVMVAWADGHDMPLRVRALISLGDAVRPTSAAAVRRMQDLGLRTVLLTGDNAAAGAHVAAAVGIADTDVVADVLPTGKADVIAGLQQPGAAVAMVGDGVNDAAALAQADLGLAMGSGAGLALDAADMTLLRDDPGAVPDALLLARAAVRTICLNLFWAFVYNLAALPLAVLGLLNQMIAGVAMGTSSVFVVANSLRLRRFRPRSPLTMRRDSMWGRRRRPRRSDVA